MKLNSGIFSPAFCCGIFIALTITLLGAGNVNAGCADDSQRKAECSAQECRARSSLVHPTCDVSKVCAKKSTKETLLQSLEKHKQCLAVREKVSECFIEPDAVHKDQIQDSLNGINKCTRFLEKLK